MTQLDQTTRKLAGLYLPTLAISFAQGLLLPAVPALATRFSITPGIAAQIVTAHAVGRVAALIPSGMLVDRIGPGPVLALGSLSIVTGALLMFLTPVFWGLLLGQCLAGIGSNLWLAGREISGLHLVRADQRGRLMSGFFGLQLAGTAMGPVAGGLIVDAAGLRVLLLANLFVAAAVGAHTAAMDRRRTRASAAAATSGASSLGHLREIPPEYRATFIILALATFSMHVYRRGLDSLLPLYAGVTLGFSSTQVGALFGITSIGIMLMIVPAGLLLDRVGRKWATVPAAFVPVVTFAAMPFARTMTELSALAVVIGLANGLSLGSLSTFSYDVIPEQARGRLQALRRIIGEGGSLTGPLAGGLIADRGGAATAFLTFLPLLLVNALLLAFGTRETLHRPRPAAVAGDRAG